MFSTKNKTWAIDSRETAPASATEQAFVNKSLPLTGNLHCLLPMYFLHQQVSSIVFFQYIYFINRYHPLSSSNVFTLSTGILHCLLPMYLLHQQVSSIVFFQYIYFINKYPLLSSSNIFIYLSHQCFFYSEN